MIRKFAIALVLAFTASLILQIAAVSQASAGKTCTYTSSDKKKATSAERRPALTLPQHEARPRGRASCCGAEQAACS